MIRNKDTKDQPQKQEDKHLGEVISFTSDGMVNSRRYSVEWDFSGNEKKAKGQKARVSFMKTDPIYKEVIQDTLLELFRIYKDENYQAPTSSMLNAWRLGLQHIANALSSTKWTEINTRQGFRNFKIQLKGMKLGKPTIETNVVVALNRLVHGGFIDCTVDGRALAALGINKSVKQYIAIPIAMYQKLLSQVVLTVETYHPYRHEIARVMQESYDIRAKVYAGENVLKGFIGSHSSNSLSMEHKELCSRSITACRLLVQHSIPEFKIDFDGSQMGVIQTACGMVTLSFSGTRIGEMVSFDKNSYSTKVADAGKEISVLSGETSKGNDGNPKTEVWQTHLITKDALELAYDMTESLRDGYKSKIEFMLGDEGFNVDHYVHALREVESAFIPLKPSIQKSTFVSTGFARKFSALMKAFDIRATEKDVDEFNLLNPSREGELKVGGYLTKLTPHDFRRTFAVFFKRYGFGNASGIKFQYKHDNINMSDYYANNADLMRMHDVLMDKDLLELMHEEGINLGVDIYDDIYNGSDHLSGEGGERIAQDKYKKMEAGHEVYMNRSEIDSLVRNGSLSVVRLPTGAYCTNSECERICDMGLFIGKKKKCIHKVNTDKSAKEMAR